MNTFAIIASTAASAVESAASTASAAVSTASAADPAAENVAAAARAGFFGGLFAISFTALAILLITFYVLLVIADWKIFTKAGQAGWKSIIPIYNSYVEYDICWSGMYGIIFIVLTVISGYLNPGEGAPTWKLVAALVCGIVACVMHVVESIKLSKCFGKGTGFGIVLFLFGPIGRLILGFGDSEYVGKQ